MKTRNKIIIALLAIMGVEISAIGTSIAFYTASNSLYFSNIVISLGNDPTLEIGVKDDNDNINYYSNLTEEELPENTKIFEPVSSMYKAEWMSNLSDTSYPSFKSMYRNPSLSDESTYKSTKDATKGFYSQELYLRSDSNVSVTLDADKTTFTSDTTANLDLVDELKAVFPTYTDDEIKTELANIIYSLRFSILVDDTYLIYDPYKEETTYFAGPLDLNNDTYYDYYTTNGSSYEYLYGDYSGTSISYGSNPFTATTEKDYDVFHAATQNNVSHVDLDASIKAGLDVKTEDSLSKTDVSDAKLINLTSNTPKRIVLSIYIEGWDLDNTSLTMYGAFSSNITFKVNKEI